MEFLAGCLCGGGLCLVAVLLLIVMVAGIGANGVRIDR